MPANGAPTTREAPQFIPRNGDETTDCRTGYIADPCRFFLEPYRDLGPVFRCRIYGTDRIAMGGVEANRFTWGDNTLWDYHATNRIFREQFSDRYLNQLEGAEYQKKRRRINQGFKPSLLHQHIEGMARIVRQEIEALPDRTCDLRPFCMRLMICMTSRVLLQEDLPDGMDDRMAVSNKEMLKASSLGSLRWLWYLWPPKLWKRHVIFKYLGDVIDSREAHPKERDDIMSIILAARDPADPEIPRYELIHDLSQLMMGGSTTTAMLIYWALMHSFLEESWRDELRHELQDWDAASVTSMKPYPKLRSTCLETERLRPSVPIFLRIAKRDFTFDGVSVAAGSPVLHLHTLAHFLDHIYDDPFTFRPTRFLESDPPRDVHGTYGGGEHSCVGRNLARIAPAIALAEVLSGYDLEFPDGPPSMKERYDVVLAPVEDEVTVRFVPR